MCFYDSSDSNARGQRKCRMCKAVFRRWRRVVWSNRTENRRGPASSKRKQTGSKKQSVPLRSANGASEVLQSDVIEESTCVSVSTHVKATPKLGGGAGRQSESPRGEVVDSNASQPTDRERSSPRPANVKKRDTRQKKSRGASDKSGKTKKKASTRVPVVVVGLFIFCIA